MNRTNFPQNGVSVESTLVIKAEYCAESHSVKLTINGSPFESADLATRKAYSAGALDVLRTMESTLLHQYGCEPYEVEQVIYKARRHLA